MGSTTSNNSDTPFDFEKLNEYVAAAPEAAPPVFVKATDGIDLANQCHPRASWSFTTEEERTLMQDISSWDKDWRMSTVW